MQDRDSFLSELYRKEFAVLFRVGFRLTGSEADAQDLVHRVFLMAIPEYEELKRHPNVGGRLMVMLYNLAKNDRKRARNRREVPLDTLEQVPAQEDAAPLEFMLPAGLSREERELLIWRYELGMDYREMARRLGISPEACRMRLSRILKKCRSLMEGPD